jgi:glutaredoxin
MLTILVDNRHRHRITSIRGYYAMTVHAPSLTPAVTRPEVSVYWKPGCSSCLKVKEFVEDQGIPFESVDVSVSTEAMDEIFAAGLRSIPAVRRGTAFAYAQSLDDVAKLLGVERRHTSLSFSDLFARWDIVLGKTRAILEKFDDAQLNERVIPIRDRSVKHLAVHIFQIPEAFIKQVDEGFTAVRDIQGFVDPSIVTRADLLAFAEGRQSKLQAWTTEKANTLPPRLATYYGDQPASQVLERAVWHCTQHARQLDIIAAGRLGAEFEISPETYAGLPLPKRLWA